MFRRNTPKTAVKANEFMECVQMHERAWGMETYANRPPLEKIMTAPVVVFWKSRNQKMSADELWTVTLHADMTALEQHFTSLLFRVTVKPIDKIAVRIFQNQKRVVLKGVRFIFNEAEYHDRTT